MSAHYKIEVQVQCKISGVKTLHAFISFQKGVIIIAIKMEKFKTFISTHKYKFESSKLLFFATMVPTCIQELCTKHILGVNKRSILDHHIWMG
jgi:hypothetical protein